MSTVQYLCHIIDIVFVNDHMSTKQSISFPPYLDTPKNCCFLPSKSSWFLSISHTMLIHYLVDTTVCHTLYMVPDHLASMNLAYRELSKTGDKSMIRNFSSTEVLVPF